jgi:hypothetical protein
MPASDLPSEAPLMGTSRFVGEALVPAAMYLPSPALSRGEPPLPASFVWKTVELPVHEILRTWRSTKTDRGDDYLAKLWYEFKTSGDHVAVVYFDRKARPGRARWWLYSISGDQL